MPDRLDLYDKKILYELDLDARKSASAIAKKIRLPKETVNYRIKRLMRDKYVKYFYTLINASKLGYRYYKVYLKFHNLTTKTENQILNYLKSEKSCANLRSTEGSYDIVFLTMQKDPASLKTFMQNFMGYYGNYLLRKSIHVVISTYKLNQKFLYAGDSVSRKFYHGRISEEKLDKTDKKIISIISAEARSKLIDIAREAGEDSKVIRYHMKKLEKEGIINGYSAALDFNRYKRQFLQVDISLKDPGSLPSMIEYFDSTNTCLAAQELLGRFDLSVELYIEDDDKIKKITREFRDRFVESYFSYSTSRIDKEYFINWSPFESVETSGNTK